jgi:hypothetical protein
MPARVKIIVEATNAAGGVFRALTSEMGAFGGLVEELTAKQISWGNVGQQVAQMVIDGYKAAKRETIEYAEEVRNLSLASGQTAEESSRMLQVLDDYQLTADDAKTATRALTKEGLAPTIDTIAKLSGEYLKLNGVEERNAFVQKNLGRAGQEWLNLLNQGPDAIMAMNDAVSDSLIMTDRDIAAMEEYRLALDEVSDAKQGLAIATGQILIPAEKNFLDLATALINTLNGEAPILAHATLKTLEHRDALDGNVISYTAWAYAIERGSSAMGTAVLSATELEATEKAAAEAAKIISQEHQQFIGVLGQVVSAQTTYYEGLAALKVQLDEGKIKTEEHAAAVQKLSADYKQASADIVMSIVEMKLAADGWTDAEMSAYLQIGQKMGKFTADQVKMAQGAITTADQIVESYDQVIDPLVHIGERSEDTAEAFGDMADAGAELGESLQKEVAAGAAAATAALLAIPTVINVDIYIRTHGGGFSDDFLNQNPDSPICFAAGTPITLPGGATKPIEQLREGDKVLSYNLNHHKFVTGIVSKNFSRSVTGYLSIDGLFVTDEHPFWVVSRGAWVRAGDIRGGDVLLRDNGNWQTVRGVAHISNEAEVYNMEVEGEHNYFAGSVLVHNKRQAGGEVYAGRPMLVGEAGAEPFIPSQNGRILGHAESLHALSLGGGMGGGVTMYNYGNVTISPDGDTGKDLMSIR